MNTIKWELEDLSFATLYPKVYDEIVRLVAERAPAREEYLAGVREPGRATTCTAAKIKADGHRPAQALLLRLPEDDRARPRLRGDLRPRRGARPRRHGARLLRGARRAARAVEPGARAGSRTTSRCRSSTCTSRCTRRSSGPRASRSRSRSARTRCTAGPSTASPRTGSTRRTPARARRRRARRDSPQNDMAWLRQLLDWQRETEDPGEFLDSLRFEMNASEVYVFTPKGVGRRAARGRHAGRLRVCRAHRGRPPLHRRRASTAGSCRSSRRSRTATSSRC